MNYKKLSKEFTKVLKSLTKRQIRSWIIWDELKSRYEAIVNSNWFKQKYVAASNRKFYDGKEIDWRRADEAGQCLSKPISKPEEIDKDILDIKAWFGTWADFKERITELEDDDKEAAYERFELNKLK